jgi:hypothetical protein
LWSVLSVLLQDLNLTIVCDTNCPTRHQRQQCWEAATLLWTTGIPWGPLPMQNTEAVGTALKTISTTIAQLCPCIPVQASQTPYLFLKLLLASLPPGLSPGTPEPTCVLPICSQLCLISHLGWLLGRNGLIYSFNKRTTVSIRPGT